MTNISVYCSEVVPRDENTIILIQFLLNFFRKWRTTSTESPNFSLLIILKVAANISLIHYLSLSPFRQSKRGCLTAKYGKFAKISLCNSDKRLTTNCVECFYLISERTILITKWFQTGSRPVSVVPGQSWRPPD